MKVLLAILFPVLVFTACSEYKKGPADMQYVIHRDQPGPTIKTGDFLSVHFIHRTEEDSLLASSYEFDQPTFFEQQKPFFKGDIFDGLALLSEGDSATFKLNFDSMQTILNVPKPASTRSNNLYFTVTINKVIHKGDLGDSLFQIRIANFVKASALKARDDEQAKIKRYISAHKLKPGFTQSGLNYIILRKGNGRQARKGDSVRFEYTGRLLTTGRTFISSNSDTATKYGYNLSDVHKFIPTKIMAGAGNIISGIDEALLLLPQGTKMKLIIPSKLAFADKGHYLGLPPYAPLLFDIEILK